MNVGDVYRWENYSHQSDQIVKRRWFVCLGLTDPFQTDEVLISFFMATTTTQEEYYRPGGSRERKPIVRFRAAGGFGFPQDCILDLGFGPDILSKRDFSSLISSGEIVKEGEIAEEGLLREIYMKIIESTAYSQDYKYQIKNNLNKSGIHNLPVPPNRRKR